MDIVELFSNAFLINGTPINIQGTLENPLFQANQIGVLMGLRNISESIKEFDEYEKNIVVSKDSCGRAQKIMFLNQNGVKRLIANSRKPLALEMAKLLGIQIFDCKMARYEAVTLRDIMKAFDGEEMVLQYHVGSFQLDMYFPKYKLALECDEKSHRKYIEADAERQAYIETQLNCAFIRFSPHNKSFCIFKLINKIRLHMKKPVVK